MSDLNTIMSDRIVATYEAATATERRAGRRWYPNALAYATDLDPANAVRAAGVIAALSPRTSWRENVARAAVLIGAIDAGHEPPRVHTNGQQDKAERIARGTDPLAVLRGPKERAFYRNITGDTDAVTVDVWAARVADPDKRTPNITPAQYARYVRAYQTAARRLRRSPREVQATTWIHARGAAE